MTSRAGTINTLIRAIAATLMAGAATFAQPTSDPAPPAGGAGGARIDSIEPAEPSEVVLFLKDGQRITGLLIGADAKQINVRVAGINTRIDMEMVQRYEVLPPIFERYEALRRSIGDDADDLVRLAQWLQGREQYGLALTEITRALEKDRSHAEALRLKPILEQQLILKMRQGRNARPNERGPEPALADPDRPRRSGGGAEVPLLTQADINLIKVYEVDLEGNPPPRLVIPRETIQRALDANAGHPLVPLTREGREAILRKPAVEVLDLLFKLRARDAYAEVQVLDQPASVRLFREGVARTWLMGCATNQCHGGLEAGRLILENRSPNSDAAVYTNLLILQRFQTTARLPTPPARPGAAAPAPEPVARPLIDWDHPERSPLLQLGLPRGDSLFPHPVVPRPAAAGGGGDLWKPAFRSPSDRLFERGVEWIRSMYRPRPEYPLNYTPLRPFSPPAAADPGMAPAPEPVRR